jgi:hypothetical protein
LSFQKSGRVLKQDVLDICGELTDGTSPFDSKAISYIDKVYQGLIAGNNLFDISCAEPWIWAQRKNPILLVLRAPVTGTATFTNGSTTSAFSSAPAISLEGRHLSLSGLSDIYRISQHTAGATSFSLDQVYLGATGSIGFTASQYDYEAVNDVVIINSKNSKIDFTEGGSQRTATLTSGSYSPTTLCTEIASKLTAAGTKTYTATFNSITRKFSIVQGGTIFSLLFGSGSNAYVSSSGVLGYDVQDLTGSVSYTSGYALSGIARMSKPITIYKSSLSGSQSARDVNKIFMIDDNSFLRDYPINSIAASLPDKFCPIEQNQDGLWVLRFNGAVQEDTRIEVYDIPVARRITDNVNSFPLIPGSFSDFLVYGAAHFLQVDKSDSKAADSLGKAQAQLKSLISFNRQGSQIAGNAYGKLTPRPCGTKRLLAPGGSY